MLNGLSAFETRSCYNQRNMNRCIMTSSFLLRLNSARNKMAAMIRCVHQNGIFPHSLLFQCIYQTSYIIVQTMAAAEIIRIIFFPVTDIRPICMRIGICFQVSWNFKIRKFRLASIRTLITSAVILMMWLNLADKQEKRLGISFSSMQEINSEVIDAVCTI